MRMLGSPGARLKSHSLCQDLDPGLAECKAHVCPTGPPHFPYYFGSSLFFRSSKLGLSSIVRAGLVIHIGQSTKADTVGTLSTCA